MSTDVLTLASASLNTKWKEPLASSSLNKRPVGVTPPGIYRGLLLGEDPLAGDRTVIVGADAVNSDHVAVYESSDGFQLNYRDAISGDITLSLIAFVSQTVVVTIFVEYLTGVTTTGAYRVFDLAEYDALSAADRDELVVLGTVVVPAAATPIPAVSILLDRRTLASSNIQKGTVQLAPIIRNPGFEIGEAAATYRDSAVFWEKTTTVGTGVWTTTSADVNSGLRAVELSISAPPMTGRLTQEIGMPVVEDQLLSVGMFIKQLKTVSSGSLQMFFDWGAADGSVLSTTIVNLDGGVDSSYREVSSFLLVPAGVTSIRSAGVQAVGLTGASPGELALFDDFNIFVEPDDPHFPYPFFDEARAQLSGTSLIVNDPAAGALTSKASVFRYDELLNELSVNPRDPADTAPTLVLPGSLSTPKIESDSGALLVVPNSTFSGTSAFNALASMFQNVVARKSINNLGVDLRSTGADAVIARIAGQAAASSESSHTLIMEILAGNGSVDFRLYARDFGILVITCNARYNPATDKWIKGDNNTQASKYTWSEERMAHSIRLANADPGDVIAGFPDANWLAVKTERGDPNETQLNDSRINYALGVGSNANPAATVGFKNHLMAKNMCAAWARMKVSAGAYAGANTDGFNIDTGNFDENSGKLTVHFAAGGFMANANYVVTGSSMEASDYVFESFAHSTSGFNVLMFDVSLAAALDPATDTYTFGFVVYGEQS